MNMAASSSIIEIKGLCKVFRGELFQESVVGLNGISLSVREGEVYGFLGPNGAGKTTTLKIMVGLNRATSGTVTLFGRDVTDPEVRQAIGYLPESPYFYDYLTAEEFLTFYGRLFGLTGPPLRNKVSELLLMVGLEGARGRSLRKFSKGMLQRAGIAQALINDPKLVILDEPMSGLDPVGRRDVRDLILRLRREGTTVFFSTHITSDVAMICDRIAILCKGEMVAEGEIDALLQTSNCVTELEWAGDAELGPRCTDAMGKLGMVSTPKAGRWVIQVTSEKGLDEAINVGRQQGLKLVSVTPRRPSLERFFMEKVSAGGEEE